MGGGTGIPVACGGLGDFDDAAVARIAAGLEVEVREVHRDARAVLLLDREPGRWQAADGRSLGVGWPERMPDRTAAARSWREAASGGTLGLHVAGDTRGIHASSSGIAPLYWMRAGRALYFCTRIDPLARAGLGSLTIDWQAWAEMLTLSFPFAGGSPFTEIRRLERGSRVAITRSGSVETDAGSIEWANREPLGAGEAAERIVAALRADVAALPPGEPVACLLTGGFDSRLIAGVLAGQGPAVTAHTVDSDLGDDLEERYAAEVAEHLGLPHEVVVPEPQPFMKELMTAAELVEYQSLLHLPMPRLLSGLPAGVLCTDGIGGNLMKGRYLREEMLSHPSPLDAAFASLAPEKLPIVYPTGVWGAMRSRARAAFREQAARFEGHPMQTFLATQVRTIRGMGTSPAAIVGRRNPLFMPLVGDAVAAAAMSAPIEARRDRTFYRRVLDLVSPGLGQLPSTNDVAKRERQHRPRYRKLEARAAHRDLLLASPLRPWFTPTFNRWIERGRMARVDDLHRRMARVQAICTFGLWCERYRDLIGEPDPTEALGPPAAVPARA